MASPMVTSALPLDGAGFGAGFGSGQVSHPRSRHAAFAWTFIGRACYGACQWGLLVALAKFGGAELVGRYVLALAVTAPIIVLCSLQLRSVYATDSTSRFAWPTYLGLGVRLAVFAMLPIALISLAIPDLRAEFFVIAFVGLAKVAESISDLYLGVFQKHARMDRFGQSLVLRGALGVACVAIALAFGASLELATALLFAAWAITTLRFDRKHAVRILAITRVPRTLRPGRTGGELFLLALPMGIAALVESLTQNAPRYILEGTVGTADLGIVSSLFYTLAIATTFVFALAAPAAPRLAQDYAAGRRRAFVGKTATLLAATAGFTTLGVVLAVLFGREFLALAFTDEFAAHATAFVLVMICGVLKCLFHMVIAALTAARYLRVQPALHLVIMLTTTGLSLLWIPETGMIGAIHAFMAGCAAGLALGIVVLAIAVRRMPASVHPSPAS